MLSLTDQSTPVHAHPPQHFSGPNDRRRELYAAWLAGRKPTTLRAYRSDIEDFARWSGFADPAEACHWLFGLPGPDANLTALRYRADLTERGLATATISRRLSALKSLGQLARVVGACAWTLEVEAPRAERYRDTAGPGAVGYSRMRQTALADDSLRGFRDRTILVLAHDLGLRRAEIASLDLDHVEIDATVEHGITLRRALAVWVLGKGRSDRERLSLPLPTGKALLDWINRRGNEPGALFHRLDKALEWAGKKGRISGQAIADIVARLGREAGLSRKVRPHGLRHQSITAVLDRNGGDIRAAAQFSRHKNVQTLLVYDDQRSDTFGRMAALVATD
jgi:integrase/recombinase XerC